MMLMKKMLVIILSFYMCLFTLNAQENYISGFMKYTMEYSTPGRTFKTPTDFFFSKYESISISHKVSELEGSGEKTDDGFAFQLPYGDLIGKQIYRNIKNKVMMTRTPKMSISDAFIVREKWVEINWNITNKTKKIGSYIATKATGHFRGRDYTVWFIYDIPVPFGPWKLHGLPGLILEGEDKEKVLRFYITEIKIPFDTKSMIKVPTADKELTHKEEVYLIDNMGVLLAKKISSKLPKGNTFTLRPESDPRSKMREKIYEWETEKVNENKD